MYNIEKYGNKTRIVEVQPSEFNLAKTLNCGQTFRWKQLQDDSWCGVINQDIVILKQEIVNGKNGITTNLNQNKAKDLIQYLNLDMDYNNEVSKLTLDEYAEKAYNKGKGIHILRQDLFETIVTFMMTQFNSMHNAGIIVEKLSETFGNKLETSWNNRNIQRYSFPTPEQLYDASIEDFERLSIGFRAKYLKSLVNDIKDNRLRIDVLQYANYEMAMIILKNTSGIGDKVANCICLFALHHIEAFPIDTHIKKIISEEYNGSIDLKRYGNIAGIIQQYMYYYRAFK